MMLGWVDMGVLLGQSVYGSNTHSKDRKSTRLNSSHLVISYAVFCLKKKNFTPSLEHCSETGSALFTVGEDPFNFRLHYDHALRDTSPYLWPYGTDLTTEPLADPLSP